MIAFDQDICSDFETALSKEWLETNGLGGFASSSIVNCNTRRYHGVLVAAMHPPAGRMALVNALEEIITVDGQQYELSCQQYPKRISPQGFRNLSGFRLDPWPVWTYRAGQLVIEKSLTLIHGQNTAIITYRVRKPDCSAELRIRPYLTGRPFHALHRENPSLRPQAEVRSGVLLLNPYEGVPTIYVHHNAERYESGFNWYRQVQYVKEKERGLEFSEDFWTPGELRFHLNENNPAIIVLTTEGAGYFDADFLLNAERRRRQNLLKGWEATDDVTQHLVVAADQFVVQRGPASPEAGEPVPHRIIAGYPWFEEWGRDTFISMPGLLLSTGRFEIARDLLKGYAMEMNQGVIPNRFPDETRSSEYNTIDASLWFILSIFHFLRYTKDFDFVQTNLWPHMREVMDWYQKGTHYGIHMDLDGLICGGDPSVQLTWMDVKTGGQTVTPRSGKPVEIQALWYNALRIMAQIAGRIGDSDRERHWSDLADRVWHSINRQFWYEEGGYLYDVINGSEKDSSVRPNQIFAVSLPFESVTPDRAERIVDKVEEILLTPFGLRTLDPRDSHYVGAYRGGVAERDRAYHQGTVWPWLIGPFLSAYQKVHGKSGRTQAHLRAHLALLLTHLWEAGLGTISEVFDGDMPHDPRGCIAQAWSVAEVLRVLREELSAPAAGDPIKKPNPNPNPITAI